MMTDPRNGDETVDEGAPRWEAYTPRGSTTGEASAAWVVSGYLWETAAARGGIRLGVVCDTGDTEAMADFVEQTVSLAWVLSCAAYHAAERCADNPHLDVSAETHAVRTGPDPVRFLLGCDVFEPRPIPPVLPGGAARIDLAVDAVERAASLSEPGPARLLVLITDAQASATVIEPTATRLARLRGSGCGVLWLCPSSAPCTGDTFGGTTLLIDPQRHLVPGVLAEALRTEIEHPPQHPHDTTDTTDTTDTASSVGTFGSAAGDTEED